MIKLEKLLVYLKKKLGKKKDFITLHSCQACYQLNLYNGAYTIVYDGTFIYLFNVKFLLNCKKKNSHKRATQFLLESFNFSQ